MLNSPDVARFRDVFAPAGVALGLLFSTVTPSAALAPTDILLSNTTVRENAVAGVPVGTLTAVDPDTVNAHLFSLVEGAGATENNGFLISGNQLLLRYGVVKADGTFVDFETEPLVFSVRIRVIDSTSLTFEKVFVITMTDDRSEDVDGDGLTEAQEEDLYGTSDLVYDSDGDGFSDRVEALGNSSPTNANSWPTYPLTGWGSNQAKELKFPDEAPFTRLATGQFHNQGLKADGTIAAWGGLNSYGQTTVPAGLDHVVAIAAGGEYWWPDSAHSLALRNDGTVVGWGYNGFGQVVAPSGLSNVVGVAAGRSHSVALKGDGTVVAWGDNGYGQRNVPSGLSNVVAVYAEGFFSAALKGDGTVVAWGSYFNGTEWVKVAVPQGLTDVMNLSAGQFHTVALKNDGTVAAWGYNLDGQVTTPSGLGQVTAVAAGGFHSMALKGDGSVVTWGSNRSGQRNVPPAALVDVKAVSAGFAHSLALRDSPSLERITSSPIISISPGQEVNHAITVSNAVPVHFSAMGLPAGLTLDGVSGVISGSLAVPMRAAVQVMVETTQSRLIQSMSVLVGGGSPPTDVFLLPSTVTENSPAGTVIGTFSAADPDQGDTHVFELVAGNGELDNTRFRISGNDLILNEKIDRDFEKNTNSYSIRVRARDASLNPFEKIMVLAFADDRTEDADGDGLKEAQEEDQYGTSDTKYDNDNDGFGDGYETSHGSSPTSAASMPAGQQIVAWGDSTYGQTTLPAAPGLLIDLESGWKHNLGLREDGTVVAWGANEEGQCVVPEGLSGVVGVGAGDLHSIVLKSDGTVVAWGNNVLQQATVPEGLQGVTAIAAGSYHNLALRDDGTVVAWGDNAAGETSVPEGLSGVVAIAAGGYHSMALKKDGTVVAWGDNTSGAAMVPGDLGKVIAIAAGGFHSVALKGDGTVVAWGNSDVNQCTVPVGLSGVVDIKAGWMHTVAMKSDGTVVPWGSYARGQAGIPLEARNVRVISSGDFHNVALRQATGFPRITPGVIVRSWPGHPVSQPIVVESATPVHFSATGLPEGLSISPETGLITGTPVTNARRAAKITADTDKGRFSRVMWFDMAAGSAPTAIALAPVAPAVGPSVMENSPAGTVVGTFSAVDPDEGDTHVFHVMVTAGSSELYSFAASGNQLVVGNGAAMDYETGPVTIRVRAIDSAGNWIDRNLVIQLTDDRTEDADHDGISEAMEEDVFFTSDTHFDVFATADADGDGIPVMIEYAFNLDPQAQDGHKYLGGSGSTSGLPIGSMITDAQGKRRVRLEYIRRIGSGITYIPQFSGNLSATGWATAGGTVTITPVNASWERCLVDDTESTTTSVKRFGRVKVSW